MADIRDWARLIRGRWDWSRFGYEKGLPDKIQFTDLDAAMEHCGDRLLIEAKHYDGVEEWPGWPNPGQMRYLRDEASLGKTVYVLWGCGVCNDPYAVLHVSPQAGQEKFHDWRDEESKQERRRRLKLLIDRAMGLLDENFKPIQRHESR